MEQNGIIILLSGTAGAALIKLVEGIIQYFLARKAKKEDKAEERIEKQAANNEIEIKHVKAEVAAVKAGMCVIMLDRIQHLCKMYIQDGYVDFDDRRRLHLMHDGYHALGGNGDLDILMKAVDELPLKELVCGCDTAKS